MTELIDFRRCLGRFATGVTVVTCFDPDGAPRGITANSFSSVSLEPPLILWNIAKVSRSVDAYLDAANFGINVLTSKQQSLAARFARSDIDPFDGVPHRRSTNGAPQLDDVLAWFDCETFATHDCGDHHIIIGEVKAYEAGSGEPLLFYRSRYRHFGEDDQ